ncbi:hypothetical protein [Klebsiella pneumoniae]|uniref:hypothetical protein n=1 Tax=Klebsiella pneumoniae TaxID=573 RepID=UPI00240E9883|nr:hypothetical protein [Klebsiella pneumoniae]WFA62472.1 hypothetical protein LVQ69_06470 [Klebsiella pneumoniae]
MNIETVNELIASLESAGELSIREQKFLKLAKAFKQLAVENVALKQFPEQIVQFICGLGTSEIGSDTKEKIGLAASRIKAPATDRIVAGSKADGVESGIKTIMTMLNHQAPGVSDAINVLRVHSSELREGADK